MNDPAGTISVIIPTCKRDGFLAEAVECVLAQSVRPLEIIVVDDGPSETTAVVVEGFGDPVRYVRQDNAGPAAARNHGLRVASGDFVGFLDDDDLWPPDRLERQQGFLLAEPATEVVLGHTQRMLKRTGADGRAYFESYRQPVRLFHLGCALFRMSVFRKVGTLNERMRYAEDDDWFMRAGELNVAMVFLPEVALYYRFHETNMIHDKSAHRPFMLHLLKNRLDRKRP